MSRIPRIIKALKPGLFSDTETKLPRRAFVSQLSSLLLAGSSLPVLSNCRSKNVSQTTPKVVIVGAGLAGLTAAFYLEKAGLKAEIYESQSRVGGRIISAKDLVADGITTELGGEFIDSTHKDILAFCREFNLPLLDTKTPDEAKLVGTDYFFNGRRISEAEIIREFNPFARQLQRDVASLPESLDPKHPKVQELDHLSIDEYLHRVGISGWLFDLLSASFTSELGLPSGDQSSLNLLVSMSTDTSTGFEIYGSSDERYKVVGGNERITTELQKRLKSQLKTGYHLNRIGTSGAGYKLSFENGQEISADLVILTLPFSVLRNVDFKVEMPIRKRRCIQELGYGMQSKLFIGVNERLWRQQGYSGYVLSDQIHNGWDSSQMQNGNTGPGSYSLFLGADKGKNLVLSHYDSYLKECDKIFPGMKQFANGRKNMYNWNQNPMTRGAYACYKVGQLSEIGQTEGQTVGNIYFAGEHCSKDFQGFMNGAVETGRKAAENILHAVGLYRQKQNTV